MSHLTPKKKGRAAEATRPLLLINRYNVSGNYQVSFRV